MGEAERSRVREMDKETLQNSSHPIGENCGILGRRFYRDPLPLSGVINVGIMSHNDSHAQWRHCALVSALWDRGGMSRKRRMRSSGDPVGPVSVRSPTDKEGLELLTRVTEEVTPLVVAHGWRVGEVVELASSNPRLLGMNYGPGVRIHIRIRSLRTGALFPHSAVMETMIHELAHQDIGPHNAAFYALMEKLKAELAALPAPTTPFSGRGRRLAAYGASSARRASPSARRAAAAAAAQARMKTRSLLGSAPRVVGGRRSVPVSREEKRKLLARAAERRGEDNVWCPAEHTVRSTPPDLIVIASDSDSDPDLDSPLLSAGPCTSCPSHNRGPVEEVAEEEGDDDDDGMEDVLWVCGRCTLINNGSSLVCAACEDSGLGSGPPPSSSALSVSSVSSAASSASSASSAAKRKKPLFWTCSYCGQANEYSGSAVCTNCIRATG